MKRLWHSVGLVLFVIAVSMTPVPAEGAQAPGAFVTTDLQSVEQLVRVVQSSPRVRSLFARHFRLPASQVASYFHENLELTHLTEARTVTIYRVARGGRIYPVRERLKEGTPVFVLWSGAPVLTGVGANPLVRRLPIQQTRVLKSSKKAHAHHKAAGHSASKRGGKMGAGKASAGKMGGSKMGGGRHVKHAGGYAGHPSGAQAHAPPRRRDTGRAFLLPRRLEAPGYRLYSYLLFGSRPSDDARPRYLQAVSAYLVKIAPIHGLEERGMQREQLNITYLPIDSPPAGDNPKPEWVLDHYDYACARVLIDLLGGARRDGPYIFSVFHPLLATRALSGHCLCQDLSSVPPEVIELWVREFLSDVDQDRFWEGSTTDHMILCLRTNIARVAHAWAPVETAVSTLIKWIH